MTVQQLQDIEEVISGNMPGWKVARGGILFNGKEKGIKQLSLMGDTGHGFKMIEFDFDNLKVVG